ncbi:signal transduction histidine kinase [Paenibacillus sp. BK033]|uniref:sensor histidine kinase n=1 Tax=Paenibacillus sp. BK033 TaxID=2512133 RepID=UPI001047C8F6|nr:sensor histidine kinase [Paenibacillus sp. BK033]TCM98015.1 signal transduction histidine kinase [Paenibacillus sp. BK033]
MIRAYLWDRKVLIATYLTGSFMACAMFSLDKLRYERADAGLVYYYAELAVFLLIIGLAVDYLRQRGYYKQLQDAIEHGTELNASMVVSSGVTKEQLAVQKLLAAQYGAYLTDLSQYRRQQEQHNHFVLQWVHHMKTPVSVIDLLVQEALQERDVPPAHSERLQSIREETGRMTRGLDMMLHTARLDKIEFDLHPRSVALHEAARSVINAHKQLCIRHAIYPRIDGEAVVETDEKWLTFILNQLIGNAIKYSKRKPGSKKLIVSIEQEPDLSAVRMSVIDEGIGIEAHDLPRVFDPFFTGENGRSVEESTGMGLYLAKQVCGRLGHELYAESEVGSGTKVTVVFRPEGIHLLR